MKDLLELSLPAIKLVKNLLYETEFHSDQQKLFRKRLTRGVNDPSFYNTSYISDLGLRRTSEPTQYFLSNTCAQLQEFGIKPLFYIHDVDSTIKTLHPLFKIETPLTSYDFSSKFITPNLDNPKLINEVLKYYADVLGNWSDADELAKLIFHYSHQFPKNQDTAEVFANSGNLFAHTGNTKCRELYKKAYVLHQSPYQKFTTIFRIAVAEIKRLNNPERIEPALKSAELEAEEFSSYTDNKANAIFCKALIKNLEALYLMKNNRLSDAKESISEAWNTILDVPSSLLDIDQDIADRYRIQIIENLALLQGIRNEWLSSLTIFEEAVKISRSIHMDSLAETLSMLGYAYIRTGHPTKAIESLLEAETIRSKNVGIFKTQEVRKMLAVAYNDLGDSKQAKYWIDKWKSEKVELAI